MQRQQQQHQHQQRQHVLARISGAIFGAGTNEKIIAGILRGGYYACKALGILSFTIRKQSCSHGGRQNDSFCALESLGGRIHCLLVLLSVMCLVPFILYNIWEHMKFLNANKVLHFAGFYRYAVQQGCTVLTLLIQTWRQHELISCVNQVIRCRCELLRLLPYSHRVGVLYNRAVLYLLLAKLFTIACSSAWTIFLLLHDEASGQYWTFLVTILLVYYGLLVLQLTMNVYYVGVLLLTLYAQHVNQLLRTALSDAQRLLSRHAYKQLTTLRRLQLRWLTEELQQLLRLYAHLLQVSHTVNRLYSVQLLCLLSFVLMECVVQLFFTVFNWQLNAFATLFVLMLLWNFFLVIVATQRLQTHLRQTGVVLAERSVFMWRYADAKDADVQRLNAAIEHFEIYLSVQHISFNACELLELDYRLIFMMGQSILYYWLILLQFFKLFS